MGVQLGYASRNVEVEGEDIEKIALPGDRLSVRLEVEAGQVCDRPIGSMFAGNPLRIVEGEGSGLYRHHKVDVKDLLRHVRCVYGERKRLAGLCCSGGRRER